MQPGENSSSSVLITGAGGYIGALTLKALAGDPKGVKTLVAADVRPCPAENRLPNVIYVEADVRDRERLLSLLTEYQVDTVIHLAAVVTPGRKADPKFLHSVEVGGTVNLLEASLAAGVKRFIYTSSGAAYGYYPDNPEWIDEDWAIRGNPEFAYSDHKRQVEEILARWRQDHPELSQLILRPGTILGATAKNQITDLFDGKRVMGLKGASTPFVFIWDQDVVGAILHGLFSGRSGIYNLAGDGTITMAQIAGIMNKPYFSLPVWLVTSALWLMKKLGVTQYGPEQVNFLRYRPVLANRRLKEEFGYVPQKTTRQVFEFFLKERANAVSA